MVSVSDKCKRALVSLIRSLALFHQGVTTVTRDSGQKIISDKARKQLCDATFSASRPGAILGSGHTQDIEDQSSQKPGRLQLQSVS